MPRIEKLIPIDGRLGIIIDMPIDADDPGSVTLYTADEVERVKAAAAAQEREECAKIVEQYEDGELPWWFSRVTERIAEIIRARSTSTK